MIGRKSIVRSILVPVQKQQIKVLVQLDKNLQICDVESEHRSVILNEFKGRPFQSAKLHLSNVLYQLYNA